MKHIACLAFVVAVPAFAQVTLDPYPMREFGQNLLPSFGASVTSAQPNLVDGRGLNNPTGIAFDYSVNPPRVWVVDSGNNRVLGWNNSTSLAKANPADIVLGQRDLYSDIFGGPGSNFTTGFSTPTAVAVDAAGNVYVADVGNNRILRFPNSSGNPIGTGSSPDLVIGQTSFSSGKNANQGLSAPTAKTVSFNPLNGCCLVSMTFDGSGNLWITDGGNNRVLRYPASSLAAGTSGMAADTVIGQNDFVSNLPPVSVNGSYQQSEILEAPSGLGFDGLGRLYVSDGLARVVEYAPNQTTGQQYDRLLGLAPTPQNNQTLVYPSQSTLGLVINGSIQGQPRGIFAAGNNVFVCDSPNNRVVFYDVYASWGVPTSSNLSPLELGVVGQVNNFFSSMANQGLSIPNGTTLSGPLAGAVNTANNDLWIVDSGNNRVIAIPSNGGTISSQSYSTPASRVLGQLDVYYDSPNLIEGKEVWFELPFPSGAGGGGGIAVDSVSNPPNVYTYIADTRNNRVLGFKNGRTIGTDSRNPLNQTVDLVIGQAGVDYGVANYSGNFATSGATASPSATGLNAPIGVAVDKLGNLYVADTGNSRVVRFPAPFAQPVGTQPTANLVLGQSSLTAPPITDPSQKNMSAPYGIAVFADGKLAVSDAVHNRILIFAPNGSDFSNGQNATAVAGQPDFFSIGAGSSTSSLNTPRHIAADSSDRLYVADLGNNRMLVFPNTIKGANGEPAVLQVPVTQPEGVAVSLHTGESWVASPASNEVFRFPEFNTLQTSLQNDDAVPSPIPLAVGLDANEDLVVAEGINRVSFFFPRIYFKNSASYAAGVNSTAQIAPGMLLNLGRYRTAFNLTQPAGFALVPYPKKLNDIQVLVNGVQAPVYYLLQAGWVYLQVPMSTPSTGTADFLVEQASTGQVLGASTFTMQAASPGIFTVNSAGTGQIAANNLDPKGNYLGNNSPANPVSISGGIIVIYLTGQGYIPNPPPDGEAPGNASYTTPITPNVNIGGATAQVLFSGLSPQYPGLWQIDAVVPSGTPPFGNLPMFVQLGDYFSTIGGTNSSAPGAAFGEPGPDVPLNVKPNGNITTMATH